MRGIFVLQCLCLPQWTLNFYFQTLKSLWHEPSLLLSCYYHPKTEVSIPPTLLVVLSACPRYTFLQAGPRLPPAPPSPEPSLFMSVNLPIPGCKTPQERVMVTQQYKYTRHHWTVLPFKGVGFIVYELYLNKAAIKKKRKTAPLASPLFITMFLKRFCQSTPIEKERGSSPQGWQEPEIPWLVHSSTHPASFFFFGGGCTFHVLEMQ